MTPQIYHADDMLTLWHGDVRAVATALEPQSVQTIVTSPPYFGLRDYGDPAQLGSEETVDEYVANLVAVFAALRPALRDDGTLWLNLGDSYAGRANAGPLYTGSAAPTKNLLGIPWRVAFALQADGWVLRSDIIWAKPNPMPESVTDRPTSSHEYVFLLSKKPRYYYDAEAIKEPDSGRPSGNGYGRPESIGRGGVGSDDKWLPGGGRNKRDVWTVGSQHFEGAHFAVYPEALILPCVLAGCPAGGTVLDPFSGSGTTGKVAIDNGRKYIGIELNPEYLELSLRTRFAQPSLGVEVGL